LRTPDRLHIVHLIGSLDRAGAELFLRRLAFGIAEVEPQWMQTIWTIGESGPVAAEVRQAGIDVRPFEVTKTVKGLWRAARLVNTLASSDASLVQTWMYHSDAIGILAHLRGLLAPQVWTLRQSNLAASANRASTRALMRLCAASSRVPAAIVAGSQAALDAHQAIGYSSRRMLVIHNGVDTTRFRPDAAQRELTRRKWGIDASTVLIGHLARFSVVKGHDTLFSAAARLERRGDLPPWRLVCVGQGTESANTEFSRLVARHGLQSRIIRAGPMVEPEHVLPAFDISVSSSLGEGFPNAVAESMACGLPVVATSVGDTQSLVGDAGFLVPAGDDASLATSLLGLLEQGAAARAALGIAARSRVERQFRESNAVRGYVDLYRSLVRPV
jgi:glycosyltransferase involved in cell wall biosynthesis